MPKSIVKLPNAPLAEVIFELRWELPGAEGLPVLLRHDPGYALLCQTFSDKAKALGFALRRPISDDPSVQPGGHSVGYRYYRGEGLPFPLWQIGPGIFACNESTNYEWLSFKQLCLQGLEALFNSYPRAKFLQINPMHLELRYVDVFDRDLLGHTNVLRFLAENTRCEFVMKNPLGGFGFNEQVQGRIQLNQVSQDDPNTSFGYDVRAGRAAEKEAIVLVSKVVTAGHQPTHRQSRQRKEYFSRWLDNSHNITRQFFKRFVADDLMHKFQT